MKSLSYLLFYDKNLKWLYFYYYWVKMKQKVISGMKWSLLGGGLLYLKPEMVLRCEDEIYIHL